MAHIHQNGKGLVTGQADVSLNAFLDSDSLASEHCSIDSGHISRSLITGDSLIVNTTIVSSVIDCDRVTNGFIFQSQLGKKVVVRSGRLENVSLAGSIIIDANLSGFELQYFHNDYLRIHGSWTRPPQIINAGNFTVSECAIMDGEQYVHIGCRCDTAQNWLARSDKLASRLGIDFVLVRDFINSLNSQNDTLHKNSCRHISA